MYLTTMDETSSAWIKTSISQILPKLSGTRVDDVMTCLATLGVECCQDLLLVKDGDLVKHVTSIQARKLTNYWKDIWGEEGRRFLYKRYIIITR